MNNYPYISPLTTAPWLIEDDESVCFYNQTPYKLNVGGFSFKLYVNENLDGINYLTDLSDEEATIAYCVYDQLTVACEKVEIELDGFDGFEFTAEIKETDEEDRTAALRELKEELARAGGIQMEQV